MPTQWPRQTVKQKGEFFLGPYLQSDEVIIFHLIDGVVVVHGLSLKNGIPLLEKGVLLLHDCDLVSKLRDMFHEELVNVLSMLRVSHAKLLHTLEDFCLGAVAKGLVLEQNLVMDWGGKVTIEMAVGLRSDSMLAIVETR